MRKRLNRKDFDYQVERHNEQWTDHRARTLVTGALIAWQRPKSIIDPACGDASIVAEAQRLHRAERLYLYDVSVPSISRIIDSNIFGDEAEVHVGDIYETLAKGPPVDMVVLTEILEHVKDPDLILRWAREKSQILVASSPEMRKGQQDVNPEHLWQFDGVGYNEMLHGAGWSPIQKTHMAFPRLTYDFGVWVCR